MSKIRLLRSAENRPTPEATSAIEARELVINAAAGAAGEAIRGKFPQIFAGHQEKTSAIGAQVIEAGDGEVWYAKATPEQLKELAEMRARQALEAIL